MSAILSREKVDDATRLKRLTQCSICDARCDDDSGSWCGACGCCVGSAKPITLKLAEFAGLDADITRYSEKTGSLCKHKERAFGKGWQ
jgi:hypothetical protein